MQRRRVVTGEVGGKSVFVSDEAVDGITLSIMPGAEFHRMWEADDVPAVPGDGRPLTTTAYFPPDGGFRVAFVTFPPEGPLPDGFDLEAALAEVAESLPGLAEHLEPDAPGMHRTPTVDFDLVVAGELWLELDDGAEVHLRPGDSVVVNGQRHAWRNRSDAPATIVSFLLGSHP